MRILRLLQNKSRLKWILTLKNFKHEISIIDLMEEEPLSSNVKDEDIVPDEYAVEYDISEVGNVLSNIRDIESVIDNLEKQFNSIKNAVSIIFPLSLRTKSTTAFAVPPVANKSSTIKTRSLFLG